MEEKRRIVLGYVLLVTEWIATYKVTPFLQPDEIVEYFCMCGQRSQTKPKLGGDATALLKAAPLQIGFSLRV